MIDGFKLVLPDRYKAVFRSNRILKSCDLHDSDTGEFIRTEFEEFNGIRIEFVKGAVLLRGSLHKFYNMITNQQNHNHNDFSYQDLEYTITILSGLLFIDPDDAVIQNLEFGVNIELSVNPTKFLKKNLIIMKDRKAIRTGVKHAKGSFTEFEFSQYYIKIYDKGKQYGQSKSILRIELKSMKSQLLINHINSQKTIMLGNKGLHLTNLLEKEIIQALKRLLLNKLKELLIMDNLDPKSIVNNKDRNMLINGWNPNYWCGLVDKGNGAMFRRKRNKFRELLVEYNLDTLYNEIMKKTDEKWEELNIKKCTLFTLVYSVNSDTNVEERSFKEPRSSLMWIMP